MSHALLIVALPAEARPLIDHFGLQLINQRPFRQYSGNDITLLECGIGKLAAAAGTAAALETLSATNISCVNVGIAGSENETGALFAAHRVVDRGSNKSWHPQLTRVPVTDTLVVETVDQPDIQYRSDCAFDMEAAGIMEAATRYISLEFIHCLKIISDNSTSPVETLNKQKITDLIAKQTIKVEQVLTELIGLTDTLPDVNTVKVEVKRVGQHLHLTVSQRSELEQLLQRHKALHGSLPPLTIDENTNAKHLLQKLKGALDAHRLRY